MSYATHFDRPRPRRGQAPGPTFNFWLYGALLGFLAFGLVYVTIGIRWHTYRARAADYARRELEATMQADAYRRAARNPGSTDADRLRAAEYRRLHRMYARVAEECTQLREVYEKAW